MCNFFKRLNPRNIDKSVSDIRIRIRLQFESSFWISLSACNLTILPDIQPANRIVIISGTFQLKVNQCCLFFKLVPFNCIKQVNYIKNNFRSHHMKIHLFRFIDDNNQQVIKLVFTYFALAVH